jgi:hypothetical protein
MRRALEVLGLGSLAVVTRAIQAPYEERFGPWRGTGIVGRVPDGPWERVAVATRGLLGLPRSETVYLGPGHEGRCGSRRRCPTATGRCPSTPRTRTSSRS